MFYQNCRRTVYSSESLETFYFEGCLSKFKSQIVDNKEVIIWVAIAAVMILVRGLSVRSVDKEYSRSSLF